MNPRVRRGNRNHNNHNNSNNNQRRFNSLVSRNTVLDSLGPAGKLRGTAYQLMEKYLAAAKDAYSSDRVLSENCLQHAEHYMRLNAIATAQENRFNPPQPRISYESESVAETVIDPAQAEQPVIEQPEEPIKTTLKLKIKDGAADADNDKNYAAMDLSVPVLLMSEKVREIDKERVLNDIPAEAVPVPPVRRRGRPSKRKTEETAS